MYPKITMSKKYINDRARIWRAAVVKFNNGHREHGSWHLGKTNNYKEIKQELLDIINYAIMQYIEIETMEGKHGRR